MERAQWGGAYPYVNNLLRRPEEDQYGGRASRHDQQPRSRHGRDPRMKDLVVELKPVNWHELGIQLEVPLDRLDKIDEDHQSSERKLSEVLRYWLLNDRSPSWDKICEALQRIGGFGRLVQELRMKYCSLKTCREQHHTQGIESMIVINPRRMREGYCSWFVCLSVCLLPR